MYKLVITELAHQDLDNIICYILDQLENPTAAKDFLNAVEKCYAALANNPKIYEECSNQWLQETGYRKAYVKNYVAVYKIDLDRGACRGIISKSQKGLSSRRHDSVR